VFNLQGSEIIIILLLALVVLGPEKLPEAMRKAGNLYAEQKKMSSGFQEEFRDAFEEPAREMRDTANLLRDSADFNKLSDGERSEKPKSAEMGSPEMVQPADADAVPVDELPFQPDEGVTAHDADTPARAPEPPEPFQPQGQELFAPAPAAEPSNTGDEVGDDAGDESAGSDNVDHEESPERPE